MDDGLREISGVKGRREDTGGISVVRIDEADDAIILRRPADDIRLTPVQTRRLIQQMIGLLHRVEARNSETTAKE